MIRQFGHVHHGTPLRPEGCGILHALHHDALDVFGVHAVGGIFGALMTGIFNNQDLGGPGLVTDWVTVKVGSNPIMDQLLIQAKAVGVTVIWTAVVAFIAFKIADIIVGLRVSEEAEREGLDLNEHGEAAYHM